MRRVIIKINNDTTRSEPIKLPQTSYVASLKAIQKKRLPAKMLVDALNYMVEAQRIELWSKALPWQVSPSSVTGYISNELHPVTRVFIPAGLVLTCSIPTTSAGASS